MAMRSTSLLLVYRNSSENAETATKHEKEKEPVIIDFDSEWKNKTPIGAAHQASIPDLEPYKEDEMPYKNEDKLLWNGYKLSEDKVKNYLSAVGAETEDKVNADLEEDTLHELHKADYNLEEAIRRHEHKPHFSSLTDTWSEEDENKFQVAFKKYGKKFRSIQKVLYWKHTSELINYYYATKKKKVARN